MNNLILIANLQKKPAFLLAAFLFVAGIIIIVVLAPRGKIDLNFSSAASTIRLCLDKATDPQCNETDLQAAVNNANPGDTIIIAPGIYNQCAVIPKEKTGLQIIGEAGAHLQG